MAKFTEPVGRPKRCGVYIEINGTLKDEEHCKDFLEHKIAALISEVEDMFKDKDSFNIEIEVFD